MSQSGRKSGTPSWQLPNNRSQNTAGCHFLARRIRMNEQDDTNTNITATELYARVRDRKVMDKWELIKINSRRSLAVFLSKSFADIYFFV